MDHIPQDVTWDLTMATADALGITETEHRRNADTGASQPDASRSRPHRHSASRPRHNPGMTMAAASIAAFIAWLPSVTAAADGCRRAPQSSPHASRPALRADGAVHSVQSARVRLPPAELERLWTRAQLENLGRMYWLFLTRVTLGLIRVPYSADARAVVLVARPVTLLRFEPPEYEFEHDRARLELGDP